MLESSTLLRESEKRLRRVRIAAGLICPAVTLLDLGALLFTMDISRRVYAGEDSDVFGYSALATVVGLTFLLCSRVWRMHTYSRLLAPRTAIVHIGLAVFLGIGVVALLLFLLKEERLYSRGVLLIFAVLALSLIFVERLLVAIFLKRAIASGMISGRRVVVIAERGELEHLSRDEVFGLGVHEVGRIGILLDDEGEGLALPNRSAILNAIDIARRGRAVEYALIIPWSRDQSIADISAMLRSSPRAIRLYPDRRTRATLARKGGDNLDSCFYAEIQREPLTFADRFAKRTFDIILAVTALLLTSPVILAAAALVMLTSPGPVFFRQTRKGFDDHDFKIWKFRTMTVMEDGASVSQAQRHDERVTRVGRILRRTSVDELPQLLNVLTGEMSMVGPRPHAVVHDREYDDMIAQYALRRHVKPGLTGLAQVCGLRGETRNKEQMERRVEKDLWYIGNWSLWLDVKIAVRTLLVLAINDAY
jgi:undecaprenyl-phosphate galactose phosphotransferase/putative colanic acid biosynthesis UDP-glucose lipid carrier transferase